MRNLFKDETDFDDNIAAWDVSCVINFHGMFWGVRRWFGSYECILAIVDGVLERRYFATATKLTYTFYSRLQSVIV